jgi:type I restriction enzyme S subunit
MEKRFKQTEIGMIPENWEVNNLGKIANFKTGKLDSNYAEEKGKYPFFTCAPEPLKINSYSFDCEAILLAGNNANGVFHTNFYNGKFDAYQRTYVITPRDNFVSLKYLLYQLNFRLNYLKEISQGTATKFLTMVILNNLKIPIPPLPEQITIVSILSSLDAKIELNNQMNKTLEAIGQVLFKKWFVDERKKEWKIKNIQEILVFEKGIEPGSKCYETKKSDNNIRFIRVGDINQPDKVDTFIPLNLTENKICNEKDILISLDATLGIVRIGMKGAFSSGVKKVYFKDKVIPKGYIYFLLKSKKIQEIINTYAQGTTILHAGHSLNYMNLAVPDETTFSNFSTLIEPIFNKLVSNVKQSQNLSKIRDSLLPKLMSGEIRVK